MEVWSGTPADYSHLKVFGCTAYAHVDNGKLEPRAIKCVFIGYGSGVKGYKLWNPETNKAFMSRSVVFNESVMYFDKLSSDVLPDSSDEEEQQVRVEVEHSVEKGNVTEDTDGATSDNSGSDNDTVPNSPPVLQS